jgi:uncharacterized RDD family membrane protein YckC
MTCPTCGGELVPGGDRCPVCDAGFVARVEGALAAEPRLLTPPARPKSRVDPLRDIPGLRKREKTWRDEVQERVRSRRQKRADAGLPLFDQPEPGPAQAPEPRPAPAAAPEPLATEALAAEAQEPPVVAAPGTPSLPPAREPDLVSTRLSEAELADLPLRALAEASPLPDALDRESPRATFAPRRPVPSLDDDLLAESDPDAEIELAPPAADPVPVERPARAGERARAAAVDALLFAVLAAVVVYFTGRAARVELGSLVASWPALAAYLGLLALFYAGYFTGTTGQTPGKLVTGLRVADASGRPPGYARAMARALVGLAGIGLGGLGLVPMAFDPAARALHDRLFRTRVVRN